MIKPRTAPGVLELLPLDQIAFQGMLDTIRRSYERFGFLPVETPVMELSEVLLTKTGGETERQVYFLQSTGALEQSRQAQRAYQIPAGRVSELLKTLDVPDEETLKSGEWTVSRETVERVSLPELAMRFDLTVPLARYVAEHEHDLSFPFRRYQIQRVYRGERAQRGRFREFYQADIDIIGKDSLDIRFDAELPAVIDNVFTQLAVGPFTIWLNNRKIMRGFLEGLGIDDGERQGLLLREVDKLDKRGPQAVRETLCSEAFGLADAAADRLLAFVQVRSSGHADALAKLDALGSGSETFNQGVAELRTVIGLLRDFGVAESHYAINLSIARGLDYYTGTVFETTLNAYPQIGSVCSGGRYDNLAGNYTRSRLPGVGISIGVTRLYWQLREAGLIDTASSSVEVMIAMLDESRLPRYLELAGLLRAAGINTEVQLEAKKLGKQLQHADRAGIRFVVMLGEDEDSRGVVAVKDMRKQEQFEIPRSELARTLRVEIEQARAMGARDVGARDAGGRGMETD